MKEQALSSEGRLVGHQQTLYASRNPTRRWLHCSRRDWIVEAIRRYAPGPQGRALEVGPGSGVYLPHLATHAGEVTALDVEASYLDHARGLTVAYPNIRPVADDITKCGLADGSFELILCSEVVEHIRESAGAIREMNRLLVPGGVLILSTPQRHSTLEMTARVALAPAFIKLVRLVYSEPVLELGHVNLMTERQVVFQLGAAGFRIQERFKSGLYLPVAAELFGERALRIEKWLERKIRGGPLDRLLWTQFYVARKEQ